MQFRLYICMDMQKTKALLMSRTNKHRIEGLYHHCLISVDEVPISVKRGWDRSNSKPCKHKTSRHEKNSKKHEEMLLDSLLDGLISMSRPQQGLEINEGYFKQH